MSLVGFAASASAQDKRAVAEPSLPTVCIIMKAAMVAPNGIAPRDEMWVDTPRLQMAIDHCHRGEAVELVSNGEANAFLSGTLRLRRGVTLLVDKDVTLYGSRNPRDYDVHRGSCGLVDASRRRGCRALIESDRTRKTGVMGDGVIDGRGGATLLVDNHPQELKWWTLSEEARVWGHAQVPRLVDAIHSKGLTLYDLTLRNAAGDAIGFRQSNGLTVWGLRIDNPKQDVTTDGIFPNSSKNITIADSYVRTGGADIAIRAQNGASRDVSILRNHLYWGHGISIGEETHGGVSHVLVSDLSMDGTASGIRIQSSSPRGTVKDVTYEDVCIRGSKAPLTLDNSGGPLEAHAPTYEDIVLRNVRISGGGKLQLRGADNGHHIDVHFDGIELVDPRDKYNLISAHADVFQGPGRVNFQMLGEDSSLRGCLGGTADLPSCEAKFTPFPGDVPAVENALASHPGPQESANYQGIASMARPQMVVTAAAHLPLPMAPSTVIEVSGASAQLINENAVTGRATGKSHTVRRGGAARASAKRRGCRTQRACAALRLHQAGARQRMSHRRHRHRLRA